VIGYIVQRLVLAFFTTLAISIISFAIIQLPPGDYVDAYVAQMAASGSIVSQQEARNLRIQYGLDEPVWVQYWKWASLAVRGNFGMAMEYGRPVTEVIGDRLTLTMVVSIFALMLTWGIALPIGIYSAVRQYSLPDYVFTFIGFIGVAIPNFLLALVILYIGFAYFDMNVGGLFSPEYADAPWSLAKMQKISPYRLSFSVLRRPHRRFASCGRTCWMSCGSRTWSPPGPRGCRAGAS